MAAATDRRSRHDTHGRSCRLSGNATRDVPPITRAAGGGNVHSPTHAVRPGHVIICFLSLCIPRPASRPQIQPTLLPSIDLVLIHSPVPPQFSPSRFHPNSPIIAFESSPRSTLSPTPRARVHQASRRHNAARRARCEFTATPAPAFHARQTLCCCRSRERRSVIPRRRLCKGNSSALPCTHQSIFSKDDALTDR